MMQTAEAVPRKHLFNIRFSDEEQARLNAVCAHLGVNAANLIRMMIKEKARALGLEHMPLSEVAQTVVDAQLIAHREREPLAVRKKTVKKR